MILFEKCASNLYNTLCIFFISQTHNYNNLRHKNLLRHTIKKHMYAQTCEETCSFCATTKKVYQCLGAPNFFKIKKCLEFVSTLILLIKYH